MSPGLATTYRYRRASPGDVSAIFVVLEGIAPEIPVLVDNAERQMSVFEQIHRCIRFGEVWIALDRDNQVVGFLLAEPDRQGRLNLSYGGVKKSHRGKHIFPALVAKMKANGVPLTATVKHLNKSNMAGRLQNLNFTKVDPAKKDGSARDYFERFVDQDEFQWEP